MPTDRQDLRRALFRLAVTQAGYFTAAQAREIGYSYQAQHYHTRRGNWVRVDRGLYRLLDWPMGAYGDLGPVDVIRCSRFLVGYDIIGV